MTEKPPANLMPAIYSHQLHSIQEVGRRCGYAIAVHGSMQRDFDLIAIPWRENACWVDDLVNILCGQLSASTVKGDPALRPHGRLTYTLLLRGDMFIDLSVMPTAADRRSPK